MMEIDSIAGNAAAGKDDRPQPEETVEDEQPEASTSSASRAYVQANDAVLLQLPSETVRLIRLSEQNAINLGRYGSFLSSELVGQPYGATFEVVQPESTTNNSEDNSDAANIGDNDDDDAVIPLAKGKGKEKAANTGKGGKGKKNQQVKTKDLCKLRRKDTDSITLEEIIQTDATNELIKATGAKTLSYDEIMEMKKQGVSGQEIIERQIAEHEAYNLKNEFSKAKYRKVKESKYLKYFTVLPPTVHNVCQYYFDLDPKRIRSLRPDSLAQMLSMANVRPGARLIVVDDASGMLTAAVAERLAGEGLILVLHPHDSPPANQIPPILNLPTFFVERPVMRELHWGYTDPSFHGQDLPLELEPGASNSERERTKLRKRKATVEALQQTIQEWKDGEFDGALIASQYDPMSIIEKIIPALAGSAQIVVHSPTSEILSQCLHSLLTVPEIVNPTMIEPFMRQYQVLPGRTHPEMNGTGHGGWLLSATRVFYDESVKPTVVRKRQRKN